MKRLKRRWNRYSIGKTRIKLAKLIEAAMPGYVVDPGDLHAPQGRERSDWKCDIHRMDGIIHRQSEDGKLVPFCIYSWDTMTACVRSGIVVEKDDGFWIQANDSADGRRPRKGRSHP